MLYPIGRLAIIDAHGRQHRIDNEDGPDVAVRLHDSSPHRRLVAIGEAYMDGALTIEKGSL